MASKYNIITDKVEDDSDTVSSVKQMDIADYEGVWAERQKALGEATANLLQQREVLISYLTMKTHVEDWHGVMDAACDLREIDAELRGMRR